MSATFLMSVLLSRYFYFPIAEALRGMPVSRHLRELERLQWLGKEDLKSVAGRRLAEALEAARLEVPFYRRTLASLGKIRPEEAQALLREAPVLTRGCLVTHRVELLSDRRQRVLWDRAASPKGEPKILFTPEFLARTESAQWRGRGWWGMRRGDTLLAFGGGTMPDLRPAARTARWEGMRNWIRIPPRESGYRAFLSHHRLIEQFRPRFIYGSGSSIYQLARFYSEETLQPPPWLRGIFFTDGLLPESWRQMVTQTFEAPAICEYGSEETGAFAFECRDGGLHLASENVHLEILGGGKPVAEGEEGEVVATVLSNRAMPLIRFNLEDRARLLPGRCPCGRNLPRIELTRIRASDPVRASRGSIV